MKVKTKLLMVSISIGMIMTIYFFSSLDISQKSFYERAVVNSKNGSYRGVITKKFNGAGREKIMLDYGRIEMDFVYERSSLYEFIQIGDTLVKKRDSLQIRIIREALDTIIPLKFENIKDSKKYDEFLNELKN